MSRVDQLHPQSRIEPVMDKSQKRNSKRVNCVCCVVRAAHVGSQTEGGGSAEFQHLSKLRHFISRNLSVRLRRYSISVGRIC